MKVVGETSKKGRDMYKLQEMHNSYGRDMYS